MGTAYVSRAIAAALVSLAALAACSQEATTYPQVRPRAGEILVEIGDLRAGGGRFLSYRAAGGRPVDFLVYRDSAGSAHAVLDACRTCYRWKKGYRLDGAEAVCIKCDMRFPLDTLERGTGSCVPIRVRSEQRGETLVIPAVDLDAGARYF